MAKAVTMITRTMEAGKTATKAMITMAAARVATVKAKARATMGAAVATIKMGEKVRGGKDDGGKGGKNGGKENDNDHGKNGKGGKGDEKGHAGKGKGGGKGKEDNDCKSGNGDGKKQ